MNYGKSLSEVSDGYLTLKHYKEPMRAIPKSEGFGYYGAVLGSLDGKYIQCHICGNLYGELLPHVRMAHKVSNQEYREQFQLAGSTALVSEEQRELKKQRALEFFKSLTPEQKEAMKRKARQNFLKWKEESGDKGFRAMVAHPIKLETKNKRGTCPDQLLDKIRQVKEKVGHTPTLREFIIETGGQRYKHLIFQTFGSWNNAVKMLGFTPNENKGFKGERRVYKREELLEYLRIFAEENRTVPTATDSKRGWIPDLYVYKRHFGSLENARQEAGIYDFLRTNIKPHRWASAQK